MDAFTAPTIDWTALSPILITLGGAVVVLLVSLFLPLGIRRPFAAAVAGICFVAAGAAAIALFAADDIGRGIVDDAIRRDRLAEFAQVLVMGAGLLSVLVSYRERDKEDWAGEYYALLLTAASGMAFFVAANNLMTLFLGLEWFSICLYILTAIAAERLSGLEASLKYLIVGSFGSAILLFGSAFVFGATGALDFAGIAAGTDDAERLFVVAGLAMIIVGLAFKASAAPFHMWTPDVYEGAPTPVTGFMAAATKVAAVIVTMRLLVTAFPSEEELWTVALAVIVCISLAWGNLAAIVQTNLKRLLAYSSISHAGFLLMPVAAGTELGGRALLYYLIPYAAMSLGAFAVVAIRERELGAPVTLQNMAGFGWERPFLGASMALFMFGFIGFPPGRHLPGEVLRLLGRDRPRLGVARHRRRRRHGDLGLLLRERDPRDVHAAARARGRRRGRLAAAGPAARHRRGGDGRRRDRQLRLRRPARRHRRRRGRVPAVPR